MRKEPLTGFLRDFLSEILMKPTTMLFRNLMAMDVEECIRAYGTVILTGNL